MAGASTFKAPPDLPPGVRVGAGTIESKGPSMLASFLMGLVGGQRAMTPLAMVAVASARGELAEDNGAPRLLALLGIVAGFLALIVPGVFALRSYRRWQDGIVLQPSFAWVMGILALWAAIVVLLLVFTDFLGLAILLGVVGPLASIVMALKS